MAKPKRQARGRTSAIKERKARGEQFRRRRINLMGKGADLNKMCGARVYILVERNARRWDFSSETSPDWPPDQATLVGVDRLLDSLLADGASSKLGSDKRPERTGPDHYQRHTKTASKRLPTATPHRTAKRVALRLQSPPLLEVPLKTDWKSALEDLAKLGSQREVRGLGVS